MQLPVSRLSGFAIWGDGDVFKTRETYQESQPHVAMQEATITTIDIFFFDFVSFPREARLGDIKISTYSEDLPIPYSKSNGLVKKKKI